jgi:hypothetical protein
MRSKRKNKSWLRNRNQMKNPKIFNVKMIRNSDGSFHVIGGETMVLDRKNQHSADWVNVDTRDFACELRNSNINSY